MVKDIDQDFIKNFYNAEKLYKENRFLESLENYKVLLKQNPNHVSVLSNIGLIYERLNNFKETITYYKKCVQILPNETILIHNLSNVYCKMERYNEALPLLKKIINLDYQNEANSEKFALCLFNLHTKEEAKKFIKLAMSKFPKNNFLIELYAKILLHLNLHKEAIILLQKSTGLIEFNDNEVKYLS